LSEIKDKLIGVYEIKAGRDLWQNECKIKRYIHDRNRLRAYARELSEKEKFAAKASGSEQSTVFKVNYNPKLKAGQYLEFRGETFVIKSIDDFEFYMRDLTIRAERVKPEPADHEEYEGDD
jgi:SPP1 family predicted phage head-tail adaptor